MPKTAASGPGREAPPAIHRGHRAAGDQRGTPMTPTDLGPHYPRPAAPRRIPSAAPSVVTELLCSVCGAPGARAAYWGELFCRPHELWRAREHDRERTWPRPWWEFDPPAHVAVVDSWGVRGAGELAPRELPGRTMAELADWAEELGVVQLWLHESALAGLGLPAELERAGHQEERHPFLAEAGGWSTGRGELGPYWKWWRPKGWGVHVNVPAWAPGSPFAELTPTRLLLEVARFGRATRGAVWVASGSITSDAWLRARWRRTGRLGTTEHPAPVTSNRAAERPLSWCRAPAGDELGARWGVALDLNLAWPAVAGSLELPVGAPEHRDAPNVDAALPGVWLIEPPRWEVAELPAPWDGARVREGLAWVTTPTMERAHELGVEAIEAWVWPEHRRYLRAWYELLRDARAELLEEGGPALAAVKAIGRQGLGRLNSRSRSKALEADELYQPLWWWSVIAEQRCRLQRRLTQAPAPPVAVYFDCAYWLTDTADAEELATELLLPFGTDLGRFKAAGVVTGDELRAAIGEAERGAVGRVMASFRHRAVTE